MLRLLALLLTPGKGIILAVLVASAAVFMLLRMGAALNARAVSPRGVMATPVFPNPVARVDAGLISPAHFGLPDQIAGYKILAILTAETEACIAPQEKRVIVEVPEPTEEDFLASNTAKVIQTDFVKGLTDRGITDPDNWTLETGHGMDLQTIVDETNRWNDSMRQSGCIQLGGPIVIATP